MVKKYTLSITLGYIVLWNVIRRIYLTPPPPFFFNLKVTRMVNDEIFAGKLFTRSDCCFGFRLGIDFNW
jgi:hypothetical protein